MMGLGGEATSAGRDGAGPRGTPGLVVPRGSPLHGSPVRQDYISQHPPRRYIKRGAARRARSNHADGPLSGGSGARAPSLRHRAAPPAWGCRSAASTPRPDTGRAGGGLGKHRGGGWLRSGQRAPPEAAVREPAWGWQQPPGVAAGCRGGEFGAFGVFLAMCCVWQERVLAARVALHLLACCEEGAARLPPAGVGKLGRKQTARARGSPLQPWGGAWRWERACLVKELVLASRAGAGGRPWWRHWARWCPPGGTCWSPQGGCGDWQTGGQQQLWLLIEMRG